jgi:hypothetical protein
MNTNEETKRQEYIAAKRRLPHASGYDLSDKDEKHQPGGAADIEHLRKKSMMAM